MEATEGSGIKTVEMLPGVNMPDVEDDISRQRLAALSDEGERPYLADVKIVQVRRGSEKLLLKTGHRETTWKAYDLTKTTFMADEQLQLRTTRAGIEKEKIRILCETLVPHIAPHKRTFWNEPLELSTSGKRSYAGKTRSTAAKRRRTQ